MSHKARRPGRQEIVATTPTSGQTNTQALLGTKYETCRFPGMFKSPKKKPKYPEYSGANLLSCHMSSGKSHFLQANQN